MPADNDYVLGTHDEEIERLGLQHRVWRPRALDAWRRGGFTLGDTILDIGCGPGYATVDLAEMVGSEGRVVGIDRSRRFLAATAARAQSRGLTNVDTFEADLDSATLPDLTADGAWCRWVLAFVRDPRSLLERITRAIRPGGRLVIHEYHAYETWRMAPPSVLHDEFVRVVMEGWRSTGGEPNIALEIPAWLGELGFELRSLGTITDVIAPGSHQWHWPRSFVEVGALRYAELGTMTPERAREIIDDFARREKMRGTLMVTPGVMEIVAQRG